MPEVYSLPASTSLLNEINAVGSPRRNKAQDGTKGDTAHARKASDHNLDEVGNTGSHSDTDRIPEVHARDADARGPWLPGWSMWRIVLLIVARCAAGLENRLLYIIYAGWIWEASNGWKKRKFTGADQHHEHAHFSFRYGSGPGPSNPENNTRPWGILAAHKEDDMATVTEIWSTDGTVGTPSNATDVKTNPKRSAGEALTNIEFHVRATEAAISAQAKSLLAAITALAAKDQVDEKALAAELVPGVVAGVVAALPEGVEVDEQLLQTAIVGALREIATPPVQ